MITNHGVHEWQVRPGLPDTGGQNRYVNQLTKTLSDFGYRVTIANRGGYPHPETGEMQRGVREKDDGCRIIYLEDGIDQFIRKEDMKERIPDLANFLFQHLQKEDEQVDLIISHYWDAALLGVMLNRLLPHKSPHVWVPHSLGAVKKRNVPESEWKELRIEERIATEEEVIPQVDHLVPTSTIIGDSLKDDYGREGDLFLPPGIISERFYPGNIKEDDDIWNFLAGLTSRPKEELLDGEFIIEISRTDKTKQKDVLVKAFAKLQKQRPQANLFLIVSIEKQKEALYKELRELIDSLGLTDSVLVIGHEAERLPKLYRLSDIYCSPSMMEGFGMSVQEAAASGLVVVGSKKIPYVSEYLFPGEKEHAGEAVQEEEKEPLYGEGAVLIPQQEPALYAKAMAKLLQNRQLRKRMGEKAYSITIPRFTWQESTEKLLQGIGFPLPEKK